MSTENVASRVFITGASGFIGRALAQHYRSRGAEVCGIDLASDPDWGVVAGDITRPDDWVAQLESVDLVIHTAAVVSNTASMDLAWNINVRGTSELLRSSAAAGVSRFLYLSSVAAYGFDFTSDVCEDRPLRPMGNTYVDTKIASEHAVLACHNSGAMDCTIVRPGDVYGPGSRPWVVLPLQMIARRRFLLPAHGQGMFSPVYVDDLVRGISLAAEEEAGRGQIFNISGSGPVSCAEFFGHHARMLGGEKALRCVSTNTALLLAELARRAVQLVGGSTEMGRGAIDMLSRRAGYSIDKARRLLGYEPAVDLEQGMRLTLDWINSQGGVANL